MRSGPVAKALNVIPAPSKLTAQRCSKRCTSGGLQYLFNPLGTLSWAGYNRREHFFIAGKSEKWMPCIGAMKKCADCHHTYPPVCEFCAGIRPNGLIPNGHLLELYTQKPCNPCLEYKHRSKIQMQRFKYMWGEGKWQQTVQRMMHA